MDNYSLHWKGPWEEDVGKAPREHKMALQTRSCKRQVSDNSSDIQVVCKWHRLDIENPPEACGVYAVTDAKQKIWYYIGRSQNIAKRIVAKNHPIQVTKDVELKLFYWYLRVDSKHINWVEKYLIKEHNPEWNGSTSFSSSCYTPWVCCELLLINDEGMRQAVLEAIGG